MASTLNASNSGAGGLISTADASGVLQLQSAGTTAVTIDTSQNVGIGTTSPTYKLNIVSTNAGNNSIGLLLTNLSNTSGTGATIGFSPYNDNTTLTGSISNYNDGGSGYSTRFNVWDGAANTERMRIDGSGNVLIGQTTNAQGGRLVIKGSAGSDDDLVVNTNATYCELQSFNTKPLVFNRQGNNVCFGGTTSIENTVYNFTFTSANNGIGSKTNTSGTSYHVRWHNTNGVVGGVYTNGSNTTYTTSSDYRLKEDVKPMVGALDKVALLKPVTYKWKVDGSNGQGFIAHELQSVIPDAVGGEKDAVNEDGSINPQGVDTSFLVATLTAAIQEQQTLIVSQSELINSLTARVTALEAK